MRVSPVGLINPGDVDRAIAEAVVACTPTHFTDVAVSGAAAVAAAVAAAMVPGATLDDILDAGKEFNLRVIAPGNLSIGISEF